MCKHRPTNVTDNGNTSSYQVMEMEYSSAQARAPWCPGLCRAVFCRSTEVTSTDLVWAKGKT